MNAAQRVSDEVERLEGHAVQLHRRMAEEDVSEEELKGIREELALVLESVDSDQVGVVDFAEFVRWWCTDMSLQS